MLAYAHTGDVMLDAELGTRGHDQVATLQSTVAYQEQLLRRQRETKRRLWGVK